MARMIFQIRLMQPLALEGCFQATAFRAEDYGCDPSVDQCLLHVDKFQPFLIRVHALVPWKQS
jgi:hypothetical protein